MIKKIFFKNNRNHTTEGPEGQDSEAQRCTIFIHEHKVAHAKSNNIRTARKTAAKIVLDEIDKNPEYLKSMCTCVRTPKVVDEDEDDEVLVD